MPLKPYQIGPCDAVEHILRTHGSALDASDTGVGKTWVAVNAARRLGLPFGIICPKAVIPSWERVCAAEGVEPAFIINYEKLVRGADGFIVRTGKQFTWAFVGLVIWDEVQRCKSPTSLNGKLLISAWKTQHIRCLCLSATAATTPMEMRALGFVLNLHKDYNFYPWLLKMGVKKGRFGLEWKNDPEMLKQIHRQIFPERGVRVRISELGDAFPENQIIPELIQVDNGESLKVYEEAYASLQELNKTIKRERASAKAKQKALGDALTIKLRARQKIELLKLPWLVERAKELVAEGRSVVIFVNFRASVDALAKQLDTDCIIRGQDVEGNLQSAEERQQNIDNFQADTRRVCVANTRSGGVGINLHDVHGNFPRVSLAAPTFSAMDLRQILGRIHRSGAKSKCTQYIVYAVGTCEASICDAVKRKLDNLDNLNDAEVSDQLEFNHE